MPESRVFSLNPSHVGLADNLVAVWNVLGINFVLIRNIEEALPGTDYDPNGFKGGGTAVTDSPRQNPRFKMVYSCPDPNFVFYSTLASQLRDKKESLKQDLQTAESDVWEHLQHELAAYFRNFGTELHQLRHP